MNLTVETHSYNEKRYGKPWIAKVDFSENKKGDFVFGEWIGQPGYEGTLEIECNDGDIIAKGQKDFRGQAYKSAPTFYRVQEAVLVIIGNGTKGDAYKFFKEQRNGEKDNEALLLAEKEALLKRIEKIDEILNAQ